MSTGTRQEFPTGMRQAAFPDQFGWLESATGDLVKKVETYVREQPVPAICWAVGIGFVLGWRLKPW